jgi:serine/threonine protein kinase
MNDLALERRSQSTAGDSMEALVGQVAEAFIEQINRGEQPDIEQYVGRYPALAPVLHQVLASLQLIRLPARASAVNDSALFAAQVSGCLGDFRIFHEIGRGGMGIVYEAEQISLGRRVALKVLPFAAAMDPKQLQRFKNEAQAAAHLQHTNIVPVYYVGCERGVHFYAMQYIEGQTVAAVIRELSENAQFRLTNDQRMTNAQCHSTKNPESGAMAQTLIRHSTLGIPWSLGIGHLSFFRTVARLGMQAAAALEHAHQLGVIHRDIKPANLLVDAGGRLWVTDFGLAHCQSQPGVTMTGDVLGTLRYMSPEQALAKRAALDARTDVYSLGVTLYELLTLEPAYNGRDREELLRQIAFEEPRRPQRVNRCIPAELETIVLKAMAKIPDERYATSQELADDLQRYLDDKPIRAKRASRRQRVAKWARRHKPVVVTAGLSATVLVIMTFAALVAGYVYVSAEKDKKQAALEEKQKALQLAEANFQLAWKAVDEIYQQYAGKFSGLIRLQPLHGEFLAKTLSFYQEIAKQRSTDPEIRMRIGRGYRQIAAIQGDLSQLRKGKEAYLQAMALFEELMTEYPAEPRYQAELAAVHMALASLQCAPSAEQNIRRAIALWDRLAAERPEDPAYRESLAGAYLGLGSLGKLSFEEGESAIRTGITLCDKLIADYPKRPQYWCTLADGHRCLGSRQAAAGRHQDAEPSYRKSLALLDRVPDQYASKRGLQAAAYLLLAQTLHANGRSEESEEAYRQALSRFRKIVEDLPYAPTCWGTLSACCKGLMRLLQQAGRPEEAAQVREAALQLYANFVGQLPDETIYQDGAIRSANQLFDLLLVGGQQLEMKESLRWALDICEKLASRFPNHLGFRSVTAFWRAAFGSVLFSLGWTEEAKEAFRKVIDESRAVLEKKPDHASTLNNLAWLLATCPDEQFRNGREAVALAKRATELAPQNGCFWNTRGISHYRVGDWNAAIAALEKSMEVFRNRPEADALESFSTFFLAMAHWQRGEFETARRWYDKAVQWMDKYQPKDIELQRFRAEADAVIRPQL